MIDVELRETVKIRRNNRFHLMTLNGEENRNTKSKLYRTTASCLIE